MAPSSTDNAPQESNGDVIKNQTSLYTVQDIPEKGKGLLARKAIEPGTLILSDTSLIRTDVITSMETVEKDLARALRGLPKDQQRAFLSLHNNYPGKNPLSNIIRSNGYPLGPASEVGGVFPNLSRVNHSCRPNAKHSWNPMLDKYVVYAIRPISEDQEITVSYLAGGDFKQRQETLKEAFGFPCKCELCSLSPSERSKSDSRIIRAESLNETIGNAESCRYSPGKILQNCRKLLDVYEAEGIKDDWLANLYYDCFQVVNMHSDEARASAFAKRYCDLKTEAEGPDSADVLEMLPFVKKPSAHGSFGSTKDWKSLVNDVPKDVNAEIFEKWLWRENV
jgi:hypothetical protein